MLLRPTHIRYVIFLTLSIIFAVLMISCSKVKGPFYESSETPGGTPAVGAAVFPHMAGWEEPEGHGKFVRAGGVTDTSACAASCHGENLEGGIGPSCKKCHGNYPHSEGWGKKENHGAWILANNKEACATKCHGTDLGGGFSGVGCEDCHSIYPHKTGFSVPEMHGVIAGGDKKIDCIPCHGADWKGSITAPNCFDCHKGLYPHSDGWSKKENHGAYVSANSKEMCATKCHGSDLVGGLSGVSCDACHTLWPAEHKKEAWKVDGHGKKFLALGKGACLGCHGDDWKGGKTGYSCMQCHKSLPEHYDNEIWSEIGHGKYALKLNGDYTDCKICHGNDFEGKALGEAGISDIPACANCHQSYPALHTQDWKTKYDGHGKYLLVDKKGDKSECVKCHGEDYKGGNVGKSCYSCHATYPHLDGWSAGTGHGLYVSKNEKAKEQKSCATKNCHGLNLGGNPESSASAEKLVYGCADCHYQYPHLPLAQWPLHGEADPTLEKCKTCHGSTLTGSGSANSCYECHKTYPDLHEQAGWKTTAAGHGSAIGSGSLSLNDCKICHGSNLDGGVSDKSCSSNEAGCHSVYPHPPEGISSSDWPLKAGHGEFALKVGFPQCIACHDKASGDCKECHHDNVAGWGTTVHAQKAVENIDGCKVCHGNDLVAGSEIAGGCKACHGPGMSKHKGGTIDTECCDDPEEGCYACQIDVTYTDVSLHTADYKKNPDKCKICHGDDFKGGISERSCFDCHDSKNIYPHAVGWGTAARHGVKFLASSMTCAGACHGADMKGGLSKVSCSNNDDVKCHSAYPHYTWSAGHGASVLTADDSFDKNAFDLKCAGCHGAAENMNTKMPSTELKMPVTKVWRCYLCHHVYPHLGFKDVADGDALDVVWGKEGGGHYYFFMYNEAYLAEFAGQDPQWKINRLKSAKGCAISTSGCHADKWKGPYKKGYPVDGVCGALCHKQQ